MALCASVSGVDLNRAAREDLREIAGIVESNVDRPPYAAFLSPTSPTKEQIEIVLDPNSMRHAAHYICKAAPLGMLQLWPINSLLSKYARHRIAEQVSPAPKMCTRPLHLIICAWPAAWSALG